MSQYTIIGIVVLAGIIIWLGVALQGRRSEGSKEEYVTLKEEYKIKEVVIDGALGIVWGDNRQAVGEKLQRKAYTQINVQEPQPEINEITYEGKFGGEPAEVLVRFFKDAVYEIEITVKPSDLMGSVALSVLQEILMQIEKRYGHFSESTDLWMMLHQKTSPKDFLIRTWRGKTSTSDSSSLTYLPVVRNMVIFVPTALLLIYSNDTKGSVVKAYRVNTKYEGI